MKKKQDPHYEALAVFLFILGIAAVLGGSMSGKDKPAPKSSTTPLVYSQAIVEDGDTIRFRDRRTPIRLLGVNAPDRNACHGERSYRFLVRTLNEGRQLRTKPDSKLKPLRHERNWVYLYEGKARSVNVDMVRLGYAVPYFIRGEQGDLNKAIEQAAEQARAERRGLWRSCDTSKLPQR